MVVLLTTILNQLQLPHNRGRNRRMVTRQSIMVYVLMFSGQQVLICLVLIRVIHVAIRVALVESQTLVRLSQLLMARRFSMPVCPISPLFFNLKI